MHGRGDIQRERVPREYLVVYRRRYVQRYGHIRFHLYA